MYRICVSMEVCMFVSVCVGMNYSVLNLSFTPVSIPLCVGLCMCSIVWEMGSIELENPFIIIIILSVIKSRNLIRNPSGHGNLKIPYIQKIF